MNRPWFLWMLVAACIFGVQVVEARLSFPRPVRSQSTQWLWVLSAENRRQMKDPKVWTSVRNPNKTVARAALLALGRMGDTIGLEEISNLLSRRDPSLKSTAAEALALMPDETALKILTQNVAMQKDPEVIGDLYVAIGRWGSDKTYPTLFQGLNEKHSPRILRGACEGIGLLWTVTESKLEVTQTQLARITKLLTSTEEVAFACAFALSRFKGDPAYLPLGDLIDAAVKSPSKAGRALIVKAIGKVRSPQAATFLTTQLYSDQIGIRIEALKGLSNQPYTDAIGEGFKKALVDTSSHVAFQALESIAASTRLQPPVGTHPLASSVEQVFRTHLSPWIKGQALQTLGVVDTSYARLKAGELINNLNAGLEANALSVLVSYGDDIEIGRVLGRLPSAPPRAVEASMEAFANLPEDRFTPSVHATLHKLLERGDVGITAAVAQLIEKHKWKEYVPQLSAMFPLLTSADQSEARVSILSAVAAAGDSNNVPLFEQSLKDLDRNVVVAAVEGMKKLTGKDFSNRIPAHTNLSPTVFMMREVEQALATQVVLKTTRGEITLRMLDEAPLTAMNFVRLVSKKFYDNKSFHRVIPHFVVQGGDPRGDGFGGPGYAIRDELTLSQHVRGTVGMATAGKDTGGSQFFINTAPNLHLDGRYTLFAEVVSGMEVVDLLEGGDRILKAEVKQGGNTRPVGRRISRKRR